MDNEVDSNKNISPSVESELNSKRLSHAESMFYRCAISWVEIRKVGSEVEFGVLAKLVWFIALVKMVSFW